MASEDAVSDIAQAPGAGETDRFVWPPRRETARPTEATPAAPQDDAAIASAGKAAAKPMRSLAGRVHGWLIESERIWLAPTALPLERRMAEAGWAPDAPDRYCNRCGVTVGPHETDEFGCAACRDERWAWARFVRLGEYEAPLSEWVKDVKFTRWAALGNALGRLLGRSLREAGALAPDPRRVVVVSVPMTIGRRMIRGVDHARALAAGVARELDVPLVDALRARRRPTQLSMTMTERRRNMVRAFRLKRGVELAGWTVILVDDVRTTGATLGAAARALGARGSSAAGRRSAAGGGRPVVWAATAAVAGRG